MTTTTTTGRRRDALRDERGVVAVELALVLPILLVFLFIVVDFGRALNYSNDANQIAANGARFAAVNDYPGNAALAGEGDTNELVNGGSQVPKKLQVCVDFPTNPVTGTSGKVGDPVHVSTRATFQLMPIIGAANVAIHGDATMRLERAPTFSAGCS